MVEDGIVHEKQIIYIILDAINDISTKDYPVICIVCTKAERVTFKKTQFILRYTMHKIARSGRIFYIE